VRLRALVGDHDLPLLAAGVTLYAVVATVPLLLLTTRLGALLAGPSFSRHLRDASTLLPGAGGAALRWVARHGTTQSWGASAACLLPSGLYGEGLVRSFGRLVPHATRRPAVRGRLTALALVPATTLVLVAATTATAAFQTRVDSALLGTYLAFVVAWLLLTAGLAVTYRWVTPARPSWRSCSWWSAVAASLVAGVGLGYVLLLHLRPGSGLPFGGSTELGLAALAALWLWVLHGLALLGYSAATRGLSSTSACRSNWVR
jgi:membrane protein